MWRNGALSCAKVLTGKTGSPNSVCQIRESRVLRTSGTTQQKYIKFFEVKIRLIVMNHETNFWRYFLLLSATARVAPPTPFLRVGWTIAFQLEVMEGYIFSGTVWEDWLFSNSSTDNCSLKTLWAQTFKIAHTFAWAFVLVRTKL